MYFFGKTFYWVLFKFSWNYPYEMTEFSPRLKVLKIRNERLCVKLKFVNFIGRKKYFNSWKNFRRKTFLLHWVYPSWRFFRSIFLHCDFESKSFWKDEFQTKNLKVSPTVYVFLHTYAWLQWKKKYERFSTLTFSIDPPKKISSHRKLDYVGVFKELH